MRMRAGMGMRMHTCVPPYSVSLILCGYVLLLFYRASLTFHRKGREPGVVLLRSEGLAEALLTS